MVSSQFIEDFNRSACYLWQDANWSYRTGLYYQQRIVSNYLRIYFQAYPGSEGCVVPDNNLFDSISEKYPYLYFNIQCLAKPGCLGTMDWYYDTTSDYGYGIGVRIHRTSSTEVKIYSKYYFGNNPTWNLFHTFNPTTWFNISFAVDRNCVDTEYYSKLKYFKINGVNVGSVGWNNKVERNATPIVGNESILRLYIDTNGSASSWQYDPRFDNLNTYMETFPKNKYTKFPRWQKTKYGLRPCY